MKLSDIFDALASGELSNLNLAEGGSKIKPDKLEVVLRSINLGLIDIYTRFLLKTNRVLVPVSNSLILINTDDFIEVLEVFSESKPLSKFTYRMLNPNTLVLVDWEKYLSNNNISTVNPLAVIEYKAKHRILTEQDIELDSEIELPHSYLNALLYFIGSRLYVSIPNQLDGDLNEGIRYTQRYQAELSMLKEQGIDVDGLDEHTWFYDRGFK